MFQRLILGTLVLFLIPRVVISNLIVEDDLFEADLQELDTETGSGDELGEERGWSLRETGTGPRASHR